MDINTLLRPRGLIVVALVCFAVGIVGLLLGEPRWSPMALFAGELLVILAAITTTTPSIPASLAAQAAAREAAVSPDETPRDAEASGEPAAQNDQTT